MSFYFAGILRIMLLEANAALLVLRARQRWALLVIAGLSIFAWTDFGALHGANGMVHPWEQYHFFLGSKYLREVGYFDLYKATILADREGAHQLAAVSTTRDLHTFNEQPIPDAMVDAEAVRARFSDVRWTEFKDDWDRLRQWPAPWQNVVSDHGNSGSPAWALVALPFVDLFGSSRAGQQALGCIDLVLMVVLWLFLLRTFKPEIGAVGLTIFCMAPFVFDYLSGSILRWDWLFALGMGLGYWRRGRPVVAGAFLGYAVVSKLFPICFVGALAAWLLFESVRRRRLHPAALRVAAGGAAAAVVFVVASSAAFGGFGVWRGYRERIAVAETEKYYPNQYSLKTVYLQAVESSPKGFVSNLFKPGEIKQSLDRVRIEDHALGFLLVRLAFTLLVLAAIARSDAIEALAAGPFLVLIWLTVNAYYWNMLGLTAVGLAARQARTGRASLGLVGLHASWAAYYLYQHLNWRFAEGYFVAVMLLLTLIAWAAQAIAQPAPPREDAPA